MDLIEHFWDLTTVSDANDKTTKYGTFHGLLSRASVFQREEVYNMLSMPRVETLGTELLFTVFLGL